MSKTKVTELLLNETHGKEKPSKTGRAFADAGYAWQIFLVDFYRRAKSVYKIDFDTFMIIMIVMSHVINEKSRGGPLVHETIEDFFKEIDNLEPGKLGLSKRKLGISNIANILDMPDETARRKLDKLIELKLIQRTKEDGIILGDGFAKRHEPFGDNTVKNFGKLLRAFDKAGVIDLALNNKM